MSARAAELHRVRGPSAMGGGFRRFAELTAVMAYLEYKLRFFGSTLGYFWQLLRPLLLFGVLYVVFTQFIRFGAEVEHYPLVLLTSLVFFTFFSEATGNAVNSLVVRETILRRVHFPRLAVPAAIVLTASFNFCFNLLVVIAFVLAAGIEPRLTWLELPALMALMAVMATGIAMIVSALFVRYRDVKPIWEVLLQMIFYGSPVLYAIESVDREWIQELMVILNPLAPILQQTRHALIDPDAQSAAAAAGGWEMLLIPLGLIVGIFVLGMWVFDRAAPRVAENL